MDLQNIENTLKKMGIVLEKVVAKVDEIDKRLSKIEEKLDDGKKFSSGDFKTIPQPQMQTQNPQNSTSKSLSSGFGSSFLGSMAGSMAGMGLYNMLFNHSISPVEFGENLGMNQNEINDVLENNFDEIDTKLDELDSKIDELDEKIDSLDNDDIMKSDYFENYGEDLEDNDFESGFDDFDGFDDV